MATPTIPNGEEHFFPIIYSGNGQGQRVGKFVPFTDDGTIVNSCIFDEASSAYLSKTFSSDGNKQTFTFSMWMKRCNIGSRMDFISFRQDVPMYIKADNTLVVALFGDISRNTNRTFEDTSKFYHILLSVDSRESTANDRIKLYIDGEQITSFSTTNNPSQDEEANIYTVSREFYLGNIIGGSYYTDAYFSEVNYIDGQALTPASFGVTDTSTGRWIPKTVVPSPSSTYTYTVTVVSGNPSDHPYYNFGSTNKYAIDGSTATGNVALQLVEGATYKFDQSDSSNSGHPLRFSTTPNGSWGGGSEYTTGVTTSGTPGNSGAYTQITVASGAPTLYYYCTNHSGMGWSAETPTSGITYGTNGFRLKFQNSSALGDDTSGNGNDLTANNLASTDQRTDTPTNNLPIMRPYNPSYSQTLAEGNLKTTTGGTNVGYPMCSTLRPKGSGKYYAEVRFSSTGGGSTVNFGCYAQEDLHNYSSGNAYTGSSNLGSGYWYVHGGHSSQGFYYNGTKTSSDSSSFSAGDVIGLALDLDNDTLSFYNDDGNLFGSTTFDSSKSACFAAMSNVNITFDWNFGDNGTFNGNETAGGNSDGDGNGNFFHSVPSGFKMLTQDNMPETDSGISGLVWVKDRDSGSLNHALFDSSRGPLKYLNSNTDGAEGTEADTLTKFLKGGFATEDALFTNTSGDSFCAWNWVANGGTTATNNDGSITSTVQANTTAGFSIIKYTGSGSSASIGHGLSAAPEVIWIKDRDNSSTNWRCWHTGFGNITTYQKLNSDDGYGSASMWGTPTASAIIVGGTGYEVNESGTDYVAYCWHGVDGFSKFGKYTGNNSADGPFIYTGFKPAFVMMKGYTIGTPWIIWDNKRSTFNPCDNVLYPNTTGAEATSGNDLDILSNGFKCRGTAQDYNGSYNYMYWAWAEHPFVGDGTNPVTAR